MNNKISALRSEFSTAYAKACSTSQPNDWMQAALAGQRVEGALQAERDALQAKLTALEKQEPTAYLAWRDNKPCWEGDDCVCEDAVYPVDGDDDRTSMPLYLAAGAAQPVSVAVPEEWKLIPIEPTLEMVKAMRFRNEAPVLTDKYGGAFKRTLDEDASNLARYNAMLKSAPQPPEPASAKLLQLTDELTQAALDVVSERRGQIEREGWTTEHDDKHARGEMQIAAACLCVDATDACVMFDEEIVDLWGFAKKHRGDRRRQLVIAGALILAEIERIDRSREEQP